MQDTVLVVEDEADMVDLLRNHLSKAGFGVLIARDGLTRLEMARKNRPDLIILNILLPHMDGFAVCKALKNTAETASPPILILTARGETSERVKGVELGADDYLVKPFSMREVSLRIQALLRRSRSGPRQEVLEVGALRVDKSKFEIRLDGRRLDLTTTEFRLLTLLIERRGHTLSREALLSNVLKYENAVATRTIDTHIRRLRAKLGSYAQRLETVRAEGYRFNPVLDPLSADAIAGKASDPMAAQ
jgi:two-component system, OmpR family, phosphate regulon response regulator PhoB